MQFEGHTSEIDVREVKKQNLHLPTVVGVDNTSTGVDEVLGC